MLGWPVDPASGGPGVLTLHPRRERFGRPSAGNQDYFAGLLNIVANSNAVTRKFKQTHGMALELIFRAEVPAGAFPKPPRAGSGREAARNL